MLWRLLAAARGGGVELTVPLSADQIAFWQDQAALLDPLAYEFVKGSAVSRTNSDGRPWYLVNAWNVAAVSPGARRFHRSIDVERATPVPDGATITTAADPTYDFYVCKPKTVVDADARYTNDPMGLWFSRMRQLGTLPQYHLGGTATDSSGHNIAFPTDFDYGMLLEVSVMDLAWLILFYSDGTTGVNVLGEVSDTVGIRWAERCVVPFNPDTFPNIRLQGVGSGSGAGNAVYLKLPGGW